MDKDWMEVSIITSSDAVEAVSAILYNTGVKGVSVEDPNDAQHIKEHSYDYDYIDEKILNMKDETIVKAYYKYDEKFQNIVEYIEESVNKLSEYNIDPGKKIIIVKKVNEDDWENNWKKYYKPYRAGKKIVVVPMWEKYDKKPEDIIIELDPGMAFGTGTHETTRMCIKALEKNVKPCDTVFDIGCGSGILSIAASKLLANKITGVDLDPVAVASAKENVELNKAANVEILQGDLVDVIDGKADIVVANIMADIIISLCDNVCDYLKPCGFFITSGIIKNMQNAVETKLIKTGFKIIDTNTEGEWVCITAQTEEK